MTQANDLVPRRTLDVSGLPESAFDSRDPVWWGNTLLIFIETTTIALLIVSYFYLRRNFQEWPPPRVNQYPILYHPVPDLLYGTINLVLIVGACLAMYLTDFAARKLYGNAVRVGLLFMLLVALATIALRFMEFPAMHFKWNDNAYGSLVWVILGTHLTYLLAAAAEFFILLLWLLFNRLDKHHAVDVTLCGGYWYWTAGTWVLCYLVIYVGARVL
jgi:heme/copper-type cytochrome/quinol oxidase subunit 3